MAKDPIRLYGIGKHEEDYIQFGADPEKLLTDYKEYEKFIKGCEEAVRKEDRYSAYIAQLKEAGMTKCAILGELSEDSKVKLEMHHGPIFNLFDICDIVTRSMIARGTINPLTTFDIGNIVLEEHALNNIMIVMLSKTVHRGGHNTQGSRSIFVDIKATFGRVDRFIDRYSDGMEDYHYECIERYIRELKKAEGNTTDNDLFATADKLLRFT